MDGKRGAPDGPRRLSLKKRPRKGRGIRLYESFDDDLHLAGTCSETPPAAGVCRLSRSSENPGGSAAIVVGDSKGSRERTSTAPGFAPTRMATSEIEGEASTSASATARRTPEPKAAAATHRCDRGASRMRQVDSAGRSADAGAHPPRSRLSPLVAGFARAAARLGPGAAGAIDCPICGRRVVEAAINRHFDSGHCTLELPPTKPAAEPLERRLTVDWLVLPEGASGRASAVSGLAPQLQYTLPAVQPEAACPGKPELPDSPSPVHQSTSTEFVDEQQCHSSQHVLPSEQISSEPPVRKNTLVTENAPNGSSHICRLGGKASMGAGTFGEVQPDSDLNSDRDPYYVLNFATVVSAVIDDAPPCNRPLFTDAERTSLRALAGRGSLPRCAVRLALRLLGRKPGWLRHDKILYELGDGTVSDAAAALVAAGLAESAGESTALPDVLTALGVPELRKLMQVRNPRSIA